MAKVLISPLGTGPISGKEMKRQYRKAKYKIEDEFVEEELLAKVLIDKYSLDKVYFLGTAKSLWEQVYRKFNGNDEEYEFMLLHKADISTADNSAVTEGDLKKLETQIDGYTGIEGSKCIVLNYGRNEKELLENFEQFMTIARHLRDGDELYIDITHSFRSLSFFSYIISVFLENLKSKNIRVKKIFYGNLDILREVGYAPVVDLSLFYTLGTWSKFISDVLTYGKIDQNLSLESDSAIYREIKKLTDSLSINNLSGIKQSIKKLKEIRQEQLEIPFKYLYPELMHFLKKLNTSDPNSIFFLNLSKYYADTGNFSLAYITLTEAILYFVGDKLNLRQAEERDWHDAVKNKLHDYKTFLKHNPEFRRLSDQYKKINGIRKNIAHTLEKQREVGYDIKKYSEHYRVVKEQFNILKNSEGSII